MTAADDGAGPGWGWGGDAAAVRIAAGEAVDFALAKGASYVDARVVEIEEERVYARLDGEADLRREHTIGIGVRLILGGMWGFGSQAWGTLDAPLVAARAALQMADSCPAGSAIHWTPRPPASGTYRTPIMEDPFAVSLARKQELLDQTLQVARLSGAVVAAVAGVNAKRQRRYFLSSEGSWQVQSLAECGAVYQVWAAADGEVQRRSYPNSFHGNTGAGGWEYVEGLDLLREAPRVVDEANALLSAPQCPGGVADVVIGPAMTALQIHESCGHALELDRILGDEAGFAGTSFVPADPYGVFRYGSPAVTVVADPTLPGVRGGFGFDDEGQPARKATLVDHGTVVDFLSSRESAARIGRASTGAMRADGWQYLPLCFSTHVALEPGEGSLADLLACLENGYYLDMDRSWSIDEQRLNFQFGTEVAFEVRHGVRGRLMKNASYGGVTPQFWGSVERVAGPEEARVFGLPCGKGEPKQWGFVSHGSAPVLVRGVRMGVAG